MAADGPGERLRVLHLITDLGKGGAERFVLDLSHALRRRDDVEVLIGSLYDANLWPGLSQGLPVRQLDYATFSFRGEASSSAYRELLASFEPHVVHTHRFLAEFLSALHLREGTAYICHGHDNMVQLAPARPGTFLDRRRFTDWLERRFLVRRKYRRVRTAFVANSRDTEAYYRRVLPRPMRDDVTLLDYGIDVERFRRGTPRPPPVDGPLRLVNVGSFQDKKNQIFIVDIARSLRARGVDFRIDLLGDGQNRERVAAAVAEAGLDDRVHLRGNVDRVERWLWESDLYLHTAWYEPFGLVLVEAMAAGLPCVILDGRGSRELIEDGRNGFLLEREDPDAFADRIVEAAAPHRYPVMVDHARRFADRFDIDTVAERFVALYRRWWDEARYRGG